MDLADIQRSEMDLKLLQDVNIVPNPQKVKLYEIYNMEPGIGFRVESWSFILDPDMHLKVALKDEFPEEKSGTLQSTGHILFQKASQIFECSDDSTIPASLRLATELESISWKQYIVLFFQQFPYWLLNLAHGDNFPRSSPDILNSKKMPKDEEFLDVFRKKYDVLCKCGVIPDREKKMEYEFSSFIIKKRHHAVAVFRGENHSFTLDLFCQTFKNAIYNCPSIQYISNDEVKKRCKRFYTTEKSADDIVELAIEKVGEMGDYDLLENNCQNFVNNLLCPLNSMYKPEILEGEEFISRVKYTYSHVSSLMLIINVVLFIVSKLIFELNSPWRMIVNWNFIPHMGVIYSELISSPSRLMNPYEIVMAISIFILCYKSAILQAVFLHSIFITIDQSFTRPIYRLFTDLLLALLVMFIPNTCFSVSTLSSVAMALIITLYGVLFFYDFQLAITLPRILMVIFFCILNYLTSWGYTVLLMVPLIPNPKLEFHSFIMSLSLLLTPVIAQFCMNNLDEQTFYIHFGILCYFFLIERLSYLMDYIPDSILRIVYQFLRII